MALIENIKINCHSSICLNGNIYIDPFEITKEMHDAKAVFLTHTHWDHLDEKSIKNVMNTSTVFVCTIDAKEELVKMGIAEKAIKVVKPKDKMTLGDIRFETFAAYNIGKEFHPKANNWVGYTLTLDGTRYTICGDTDATKELQGIKTDVLLIPIGGTYTLDAAEAAKVTNIIKPKLVIPTHYGKIVGGKAVEKTFINALDKEIKYKILIKE